MKTLDSGTFAATVGEGVHLVSFSADWCAPCVALTPLLGELAEEAGGRYSVAKVDIDASPELASRYEVQSVPTLVVIKDGELRRRIVGPRGKRQLALFVDEYVDEPSIGGGEEQQ